VSDEIGFPLLNTEYRLVADVGWIWMDYFNALVILQRHLLTFHWCVLLPTMFLREFFEFVVQKIGVN